MTDMRERATLALGLSLCGAVALTVLIQLYALCVTFFVLPGGRGFEAYAATLSAQKILSTVALNVPSFWGLASWRLPLWLAIGGAVILALAIVPARPEGDPNATFVAGVAASTGIAAIVFLRFVAWAERKWTSA